MMHNVERKEYERLDFNKARIAGTIINEFVESHRQNDNIYVKTWIRVPRTSGNNDILPVIVDKNDVLKYSDGTNVTGKFAEVRGRLCSYAMYTPDVAPSVERYIFASNMHITENEEELESPVGTNIVSIKGEIKEDPVFRFTASEKILSSFYVLSHRKSGKCDRIPCIAWNFNALGLMELGAQSEIWFKGRLQSRDYIKRNEKNGQEVKKTAYEVSIFQYNVLSVMPRNLEYELEYEFEYN